MNKTSNDIIRFFSSGNDQQIKGNRVTGYGTLYNVKTERMPGWILQIDPGAFSKSIRESDIRALKNHDDNYVLGRNKAGTLRLSEDSHGLQYEIDLPNTSYANDLKESLSRGDVSGSSVGFYVVRDSWKDYNDAQLNTVHEGKLYDVSVVTNPQFENTSANLFEKEIDYDRLQFLQFKKNRGISLSQDEIAFIKNIFNLFNISSNADSENHLAIVTPDQNSTLQQRLEAFEASKRQ